MEFRQQIIYILLQALFLLPACNDILPDHFLQGSHHENMVWVPGGKYPLPGNSAYSRETTTISGFWMDATEVTNAQFEKFVKETGYITTAERPISWVDLSAVLPDEITPPHDSLMAPGSLVFDISHHSDEYLDFSKLWVWKNGADWRHPQGPGSSIRGKENHPVVQVTYKDALAYAQWVGKRLPTELEWEYAAKQGEMELVLPDHKRYQANYFQGSFPEINSGEDGFVGTAPTKSFPPNNLGLFDMIGNVWEWTSDWYHPGYAIEVHLGADTNKDMGLASLEGLKVPEHHLPKRVVKGGSYFCISRQFDRNLCRKRMPADIHTGMENLGFRCVKDK